jgi:hypothetical protein
MAAATERKGGAAVMVDAWNAAGVTSQAKADGERFWGGGLKE